MFLLWLMANAAIGIGVGLLYLSTMAGEAIIGQMVYGDFTAPMSSYAGMFALPFICVSMILVPIIYVSVDADEYDQKALAPIAYVLGAIALVYSFLVYFLDGFNFEITYVWAMVPIALLWVNTIRRISYEHEFEDNVHAYFVIGVIFAPLFIYFFLFQTRALPVWAIILINSVLGAGTLALAILQHIQGKRVREYYD